MLIPQKGNPHGTIDSKQIKSAAEFSDEAAVQLVVQDSQRARAYLAEKQWALRWKEIDLLYQSPRPVTNWEGTQVQEANVTSYLVAKHINTIVPKLYQGLFYADPPFLLRPRPGTDQDTVRAKTAVFSTQLDEMHFKSQVEDGLFSTVLLGTAIYKWGWLTCHKTETRYVRKKQPTKINTDYGSITVHTKESDEFDAVETQKITDRPHFEHIPLDHVLVDPGLEFSDIRRAKWVTHVMYLTFNDLNDLRDEPGWNIPSEEVLRSWFDPPAEQAIAPGQTETVTSAVGATLHSKPRYQDSTADPLQHVLKVEERWDADKVIAVLQDKLCVRNEANPFGEPPFYSSHWWRISKSFYSLGVGHLVGSDQRVSQGLRNAALNILGLACNPTYLRSRGANIPTQMIRQRRGAILDVDGDINAAFKILEIPKVPPEVWQALANAEAEAEGTSGADPLLQQGNTQGGRTSMGRTSGGANILASASDTRLEGPLTRFINNVFQPWIYQMDELDRERLPMSTLRDILAEELEPSFDLDPEKFLNAKLEYEILAGAHLTAKRGMAQILPMISQIFENQALLQQLNKIGWTVDVKELFDMFMEISDWRNQRNLIRKLTPEEMQLIQGQDPAAAKIKGAMMLEDKKAANQAQLQDSKNEARAVDEVLRQTLEQAMSTEAVEGQPGNKGFGDNA